MALAGKQAPVTYEYYNDDQLSHAMKRFTLPKGNSMTFEYYMNGKVFRHYNSLGETMTFTYNDFRRESVTVNERGDTRRFFFDRDGNPTEVVQENGGEYHYTYDPANPMNRISKRSPMGYLTQYEYDGNGNVIKVTHSSGGTVEYFNFNVFNQPGKIKDANGNYTLFQYDASGNLLERIALKAGIGATIDPASYLPNPADIAAWTSTTYDGNGNPLIVKQVRNFATQEGPSMEYTYTDTVNGVTGLNPVTITRYGDKNGDGVINRATEFDTASLSYDALGRTLNGLGGSWYATQFEYDDVDRVTRTTDAVGQTRALVYDANGNPIGNILEADANGVATRIDQSFNIFDFSDRKIMSLDAGGNISAFQYDAAGNVVQITNPDGYTLAFDYDKNNQVLSAHDEEGHTVSRTLDLDGKPRTVTDPNGNTLSYSYYGPEKDGRLKTKTDATGSATTFDYDNNGNVIAVTDPMGRTTTTSYDALNRPTRIVGPAYTDANLGLIRPVTRYTYDTLGNLTTVSAGHTDSSGTSPASDVVTPQMSFAYDDFGRKIRETDPLGKSWTFEYDRHGNMIKRSDAKNQVTTFTYGYGGQLLTQTDHNGNETRYVRNALGQVKEAHSPEITYVYQYDTAHRLSSAASNQGKTLRYQFSPGGMLNSMTDNEGGGTHYLYDPVGRLTGILAPSGDQVSYIYDAGGRLTEKWFPNGVNTRYTYNADNTLQQLVNRSDTNTIISQHDYSYDLNGNRLTHNEIIGGMTTPYGYAYNELNQLTEVKDGGIPLAQYGYDPIGNRKTETEAGSTRVYITDPANQLKEVRQDSETGALLAALDYDDNGNLIAKTEGSITTDLFYDALNRLVQVDQSAQSTQSYRYDDQGRRIKKTVGSDTTNYLYNGPDLLKEYGANWGTPTASYVHGPYMDDPILRATVSGTQYYHQDGLGSVVAMSDASGLTTGTRRYDAWGNVMDATGTVMQYGYTGREPDGTGLIYYRARYYDPAIGRFTQRDPIGLNGGMNLYAYVGNNPVNFNDPLGLLARDPLQTADASSYFNGAVLSTTDDSVLVGPGSFQLGNDSTIYNFDRPQTLLNDTRQQEGTEGRLEGSCLISCRVGPVQIQGQVRGGVALVPNEGLEFTGGVQGDISFGAGAESDGRTLATGAHVDNRGRATTQTTGTVPVSPLIDAGARLTTDSSGNITGFSTGLGISAEGCVASTSVCGRVGGSVDFGVVDVEK